jgi:hypothetical protein
MHPACANGLRDKPGHVRRERYSTVHGHRGYVAGESPVTRYRDQWLGSVASPGAEVSALHGSGQTFHRAAHPAEPGLDRGRLPRSD